MDPLCTLHRAPAQSECEIFDTRFTCTGVYGTGENMHAPPTAAQMKWTRFLNNYPGRFLLGEKDETIVK